jgi:hypothetical protein
MLCELMNPDSLSKIVLEGLFISTIGFAHRRKRDGGNRPPYWLEQTKDLLRDTAKEASTMEGIAQSRRSSPCSLVKGVQAVVSPHPRRVCEGISRKSRKRATQGD